ncbi:MAG: adenylate/guanylate cyclase domain-containing protein [Myxococcota bacterium]
MTDLPQRMRALIQRLDMPLVVLALVVVIFYLFELNGTWELLGLEQSYIVIMRVVDIIFVLDLLLKIALRRRQYLTTPGFIIDLLSCLPAFELLPGVGQGMRFIRILRVFRFLRALRLVRTLEVLRLFNNEAELPTPAHIRAAVAGAILLYALMMSGMIGFHYANGVSEDLAARLELNLLIGSLLGIILTLTIIRLQLPALSDTQLRALFRVTLPSQMVDRLLIDPDLYHRTQRTHATVIFCDISGFTSTVETLRGDLSAVKNHLERVMDAVTDVHLQHDLIIDKFIGDAIMSFRGGELVEGSPEEHAYRVVRASLESIAAVEALADPHFHRIKIGGASSTEALIGAFGTSKRLSYTILGDRVNLAARLEAAVKQCGTTNLFDDFTHQLLKDRPDLKWRRFGRVKVSGKVEPIEVFEVFDPESAADWGWLDRYHDAVRLYDAGKIEAAAAGFLAADAARPGGDRPARLRRERCLLLLAAPSDAPAPPFSTTK